MCYICMFMHSETDRTSRGLRSKPNKIRDCITDTPKKTHACHAYNYNTYNVLFVQYNIRTIYHHIMYIYTHIILYYLIIYIYIITYIHILCICIRGLFYIYIYHVILVAYIMYLYLWNSEQPYSHHFPSMSLWTGCLHEEGAAVSHFPCTGAAAGRLGPGDPRGFGQ